MNIKNLKKGNKPTATETPVVVETKKTRSVRKMLKEECPELSKVDRAYIGVSATIQAHHEVNKMHRESMKEAKKMGKEVAQETKDGNKAIKAGKTLEEYRADKQRKSLKAKMEVKKAQKAAKKAADESGVDKAEKAKSIKNILSKKVQAVANEKPVETKPVENAKVEKEEKKDKPVENKVIEFPKKTEAPKQEKKETKPESKKDDEKKATDLSHGGDKKPEPTKSEKSAAALAAEEAGFIELKPKSGKKTYPAKGKKGKGKK